MSSRYSFCISALLILLAMAPPAAVSQNAAAGWKVEDLTGAIALDSVEEHDSVFTLSFKNISASIVTAASLSLQDGTYHYEDWFAADTPGCAPGQYFQITAGPEEIAQRKIRIAAVLFEDGSGKGDALQLDRMNLHRFGQIMEAARIGSILQGRKNSDDAAIRDLKRKIGSMPKSADDAFQSLEGVSVPGINLSKLKHHTEKARRALWWGVSITREEALRRMDIAEELPTASDDENTPSRRSFLSVVQDVYEKQNKKGIALLHRMQGGQ